MKINKKRMEDFPLKRCRCAAAASSEPSQSFCIQVSLCIQSKHKPCSSASLMTSLSHTLAHTFSNSLTHSHTHSRMQWSNIYGQEKLLCYCTWYSLGRFLLQLLQLVFRHRSHIQNATNKNFGYLTGRFTQNTFKIHPCPPDLLKRQISAIYCKLIKGGDISLQRTGSTDASWMRKRKSCTETVKVKKQFRSVPAAQRRCITLSFWWNKTSSGYSNKNTLMLYFHFCWC